MNKIENIGGNELLFNNDEMLGIHSGGFSVQSIMMRAGMSPVMTLNTQNGGSSNKVSDLFNNLVVPNWAISYNTHFGKYEDTEESDEEIGDELYDKLLDLVRETDTKQKHKKTKKQNIKQNAKKSGTKKKRK